jgi:signal transduction histidine kinase
MQKNQNIQDYLIRKIVKVGAKGPLLITVVSAVVSVIIYLCLTAAFGMSLCILGFIAAILTPAVLAYPSMYFIFKVTTRIQERSKEAEMNNSLKNTLLSVVAHDVKGPLINIDSLLDLYFQKEISKDELSRMMKELQQQVKTNLDFVMNILQWTKTQFDGFQIIKAPVDLKSLTRRIIDAYQFQIQQKKITVETDINLTAKVDRDLIRLVLRNLISNAIKYSDLGGKIEIEMRIENGALVTKISDNGLGMNKAKIESLFDKNNLHSSKGTYLETGTGLGLKLCKTFIDALGGSIGAESEPGKGSVFYFTIPQ